MQKSFLPLLVISSILGLLFLSSCISTHNNITYQEKDAASQTSEQYLNIFTPVKTKSLKDVFVFIHGGGWDSGSPSTYDLLGRKMARKGIVAVIISYPLSPTAQYDSMALAAAEAIKWVKNNIANYGGDPENIFVSGHSAGGHLAALIALDDRYFDAAEITNPVKGLILIDAAGLDMYSYLKRNNFDEDNTYIKTFTNNPETWKDASPLYYLDQAMPPMLIYRGGKTYPSIERSTKTFVDSLKTYNPNPNYRVLDELDHIAMIAQFLFSSNLLYDEIINFMQENN
jgi:acetyl esterase/lipase